MKKCLFVVIIALLYSVCLTAQASSQQLWYSTTITNKDRYNSKGQRLKTVRAILRQDRANVHKYGKADPGDKSEAFFKTAANRNIFANWKMDVMKGFGKEIVYGKTPVYVTVGIYFQQRKIAVAPTG